MRNRVLKKIRSKSKINVVFDDFVYQEYKAKYHHLKNAMINNSRFNVKTITSLLYDYDHNTNILSNLYDEMDLYIPAQQYLYNYFYDKIINKLINDKKIICILYGENIINWSFFKNADRYLIEIKTCNPEIKTGSTWLESYFCNLNYKNPYKSDD